MNIVLIGAHPDDCELNAAGTVVKWAAEGYNVVMVSMTNGDIGHHELAGGPLARRRVEEARLSAQRAGVDSVVFDNHDGELQPTLAVRKEVVTLIREREADLVITHRPNDYHPDHRYTSQVVQDAAYMVTVPHFAPDAPALRKNPVFMYFMDRFQKPIPFRPDVAVAVDDVMDHKWRILDAMESQMYEWLPWHAGRLDEVPADPKARVEFLKTFWTPLFEQATTISWKALQRCYGVGHGGDPDSTQRIEAAASRGQYRLASTRFAESFELSEYGHQPTGAELKRLFPFVPRLGEGAP